ncbi:MAG TPA: DNA recombination protein RmuC [Magnetospirillaceae bacterium]|nr:DNA recombination protein RmuC [Magnetospirillaceae bacterium]
MNPLLIVILVLALVVAILAGLLFTGRRQREEGLAQAVARRDELQAENAGLKADIRGLEERLKLEREQSAEKLELLKDAKERLSQEFRLLAHGVMKEQSETFSRQNREQIGNILTPLKESLTGFQQILTAAHTDSTKERATLAEQIRRLTEESAKMTNETGNLTRALKGKAQTQGAWGEMILQTILERSGLREGDEFVTQLSHSAEDGRRLRPDVIVNLPNSQKIVLDSKVSLTAFEAYVNAETDLDRAANLASHVQSLRSHIRDLSRKEYHQLDGASVDYVIMFVPIEGALAAALVDDPGLTAHAIDHNVTIATPTTLMIALRTVANVWQVERRNRNAEAIADRAGKLYEKFAGFLTDMGALGDRLTSAQKAYGSALGKLQSGPGNVVRQIEQLKELGARTSKSLSLAAVDDGPLPALEAPEGEA